MAFSITEQIRLMPYVTEFRCWWLKREPGVAPDTYQEDGPKTQPDGYVHQCFWFAVANGKEYAETLDLDEIDKRLPPELLGLPPLSAEDLRLLMLKRAFECTQQADPALEKENVTRLRPA